MHPKRLEYQRTKTCDNVAQVNKVHLLMIALHAFVLKLQIHQFGPSNRPSIRFHHLQAHELPAP
jgi:hypothetical protein